MNFAVRPLNAALVSSVAAAAVLAFQSQARAQATQAEEVVITGTLIRGAAAIGVPVTELGADEFAESGAITVSDLFKTVPSVVVPPTQSVAANNANYGRNNNVDIHNLGPARTLVLVNGARVAMNGWSPNGYDPSIIPAISLQRADYLGDGASATYGSDGIAGVINLVLRRGYDGAISQLFASTADGDALRWQASQLYGTTWDGGDVTIGFEYYDQEAFPASEVDDFYTYDFSAFGIADNTTPIQSAIPAIVSQGPAATGQLRWGVLCTTNCFSVPAGTGWDFGTQAAGPTVSWATLLANRNVNNLYNPWKYSTIVGEEQRAAVTLTFDQRITDDIELFVDAFYSNRRNALTGVNQIQPLTGGAFSVPILNPADYPYTPTGAPAGLVVNYSTQYEVNGPYQRANEIAGRYAAGFNIELPFDWNSRIYYAVNEVQNSVVHDKVVNGNNVNAAIGNVVFDPRGRFMPYVISNDPNRKVTAADIASQSAVVKALFPAGTDVRVISPSTVPFLNLFCDPTAHACNDPRTLAFISGHDRYEGGAFILQQAEATFTGPLFELPGGTVQGAIGASYVWEDFDINRDVTFSTFSAEFPQSQTDHQERQVWAVFGELRVPIFGEGNAIPVFQRLELQLSGRYDHYSDFGDTTNPKIGANWEPFDGFTARGSWGKSFRAPTFGNLSAFTGKNIQALGLATGGPPANPRFQVCTNAQQQAGSAPTPGTLAARVLSIVGAANCSNAAIAATQAAVAANPANPFNQYALGPANSYLANIRLPGTLLVTGGPGDGIIGLSNLHPPGYALGPETAESWSLGFDYAPPFLPGLSFGVTYFNHHLENLIGSRTALVDWYNNPDANLGFMINGEPGFNQLLNWFIDHPLLPAAANTSGVTLLWDLEVENIGTQDVEGIDVNAGYDWDMGEWGLWNVGITANYMLKDESQLTATSTPEDVYDSSLAATLGHTTLPRVRARAQLGWEGDSGFSLTGFVNYQSHYFRSLGVPTFPAAGVPGSNYRLVPSYYTFDLSAAYDTGDNPANEYLQNLNIRLTVNNILDRDPPFAYNPAAGTGGFATIDATRFSPLGRTISLSVTKTW